MSFLSSHHHFWDVVQRKTGSAKAGRFSDIAPGSMLAQMMDTGMDLSRRAVDRVIAHAFFASPSEHMVTLSREEYAVPPRMHPVDRWHLYSGSYEAPEIGLLKEFNATDAVIEAGANIGFMACQASRFVKPGGSYVCVEPDPDIHPALHRNLERAKQANPQCDFHIVQAAVGGPHQNGGMLEFAQRRTLGSALAHSTRSRSKDTIIPVPVRSLSALVDQYVPAGKSASLICDIEGGEIELLRHPAMFARIGQVAIELHGPGATGRPETPRQMMTAFEAMGYRTARVSRNGQCCLFKREPA